MPATTFSVPPEQPRTQLRRLWIEEPTFSRTTAGSPTRDCGRSAISSTCVRNSAATIGPHTRPSTIASPQPSTRSSPASSTPVFLQDYHLALVAPALRRAAAGCADGALLAHSVAVSGSSADLPMAAGTARAACWRTTCSRFSSSAIAGISSSPREEELGADVEAEASRVRIDGRATTVVSVPIGVDYDRIQEIAGDAVARDEQQRLRALFDLRAEIVGIGVDRLDYTKGIPERLAALDALLTRRPELRGRLTFLQIGVPSRSDLDSYAAIEAEIDRARRRSSTRGTRCRAARRVVCYHKAPLRLRSLVALYRLAHFCIVSSLHDGMNLVAKEFVAARDDDDGVLVLSALAGAAQELHEALIINPYDVDGFADALLERDRHAARTSGGRACARCGASSPDATCSAGRRTSSKGSRACGPGRCSIAVHGWEEISV